MNQLGLGATPTTQSSTMSTVIAVLALSAGAIFLYEAFAPKTVTTEFGNKLTIYTYRGVPYHVWMSDHGDNAKNPWYASSYKVKFKNKYIQSPGRTESDAVKRLKLRIDRAFDRGFDPRGR